MGIEPREMPPVQMLEEVRWSVWSKPNAEPVVLVTFKFADDGEIFSLMTITAVEGLATEMFAAAKTSRRTVEQRDAIDWKSLEPDDESL